MAKDDRKTFGGSMVAPHPPADGRLHPVEELAVARGVGTATMVAICRASGWLPGKQVTEAEFDQALEKFRGRAMGGGRI